MTMRPRARLLALAVAAAATVLSVAHVAAASAANAPSAAPPPPQQQHHQYDEAELAASLEATGGLAGRGTGDLFTFVGAAANAAAEAATGGAAGAAAAGKKAALAAAAAGGLGPITPAKVLWPWADGSVLRTRLKVLNATLPASLKPALRDYFSALPGKMCGAMAAAAMTTAAAAAGESAKSKHPNSAAAGLSSLVSPPNLLPKLLPDIISDNLCPYKVMQRPLNGVVGPSTWGVVAMEWAGGPYFAMQRALDFCEILYAPELACDRALAARLLDAQGVGADGGGGGGGGGAAAGGGGGDGSTGKQTGSHDGGKASSSGGSGGRSPPPNPRSTPLRLCSLLATPEFPGGKEGCKDPWADAAPALYWKYVQRKLSDRFPGLGAVAAAKKLPDHIHHAAAAAAGGLLGAAGGGAGGGGSGSKLQMLQQRAAYSSEALRKLPQAIRAAPDFLFDDLKGLWATPAALDAAVAAAERGRGGGKGGDDDTVPLSPDGPLGVLLCPPSPVKHHSGAGYPNVGPLVSIARLMWRMDAPQAAIAALADTEAEAAAANRALCSAITQRLAKDVTTVKLYPARGMGPDCVAVAEVAGGGDPAACPPADTTLPRPASPDSARGRVAAAAKLSITVDQSSLRRTRVQRWSVSQAAVRDALAAGGAGAAAAAAASAPLTSATVEGGGAPASFAVSLSRDGPASLVRVLRGTFAMSNRDATLPISATRFVAEVTARSGDAAKSLAAGPSSFAAPAPLGGSRQVEGASSRTTTYHDLSLSTACGIYRPLAPGQAVTCPYELVLPPGAPDRADVRLLAVVAPATAADLAAAQALEGTSSSSASSSPPSSASAAAAEALASALPEDEEEEAAQLLLWAAAEGAKERSGGGSGGSALGDVGAMLAGAKSPEALASKAQDALKAAGVKLREAQIKAQVLRRGGLAGDAPQLARQGGTWVLGDGSSRPALEGEEGGENGKSKPSPFAKKAASAVLGVVGGAGGAGRGAERDESASSAAARRAATQEAPPASYDFSRVPERAAGVCARLKLEGLGGGARLSGQHHHHQQGPALAPKRVALRGARGEGAPPAGSLAALAANLTSAEGLKLCGPATVAYSLAYDAPLGAFSKKKGGGAKAAAASEDDPAACDPSRPARAPLQQVFEAAHTVSVAPERGGGGGSGGIKNKAAPPAGAGMAAGGGGKTLAEAMAEAAAAASAAADSDPAVGLLPRAYVAGPFLVRVIATPPAPPCALQQQQQGSGGGGDATAAADAAAAATTGTRAAMLAASLQGLRAVPQAPRVTLKHGVALPARKNQAALIATTPWAVSRGLREAAQRAADAEAAAAATEEEDGGASSSATTRRRGLLQLRMPASLQGLAQGLVGGGTASQPPPPPPAPARRGPAADVRRSPAAQAVLAAPTPTALVRVSKQRLADTLNLRSAVTGALGGGPIFLRLDVTVGAAAAAPQGGTFTLLGQPTLRVRSATNPRVAAAAPGNVWRVRGANVTVFATEADASARRASAVVPARFAVRAATAAPQPPRGVAGSVGGGPSAAAAAQAAAAAATGADASSSSGGVARPGLLIPPYIEEATGQSLAEVIVWTHEHGQQQQGGGSGSTTAAAADEDDAAPRPLPQFAQLTVAVDRLTDPRVSEEVRAAAEGGGFPSPDVVWRLLAGGGGKDGASPAVSATPAATVEGPVQPLLPYTADELAAVAAAGGAEAPCLTLHAPAPFVRVLSAQDDTPAAGPIDAAARAVAGVATPGGRRRRAAMRSGAAPAVKLVNPALEEGGGGAGVGGMGALAPLFGWTNRTAAKAAALAAKQKRALALASEAVSSVPLEVASALISQSGVEGVGGSSRLPGAGATKAAAAGGGAAGGDAAGLLAGGAADAPDGFGDPDPVARALAESGTAVVCPHAGAPPLAWTMPYRIGPFERCGVYDVVVSAFGSPGAKASAAAVAPSERVVRVVVDEC
jgi:hypothetical protein